MFFKIIKKQKIEKIGDFDNIFKEIKKQLRTVWFRQNDFYIKIRGRYPLKKEESPHTKWQRQFWEGAKKLNIPNN